MEIEEIETRRDQLEEKIETILNEFVANTGVRIEKVEVRIIAILDGQHL